MDGFPAVVSKFAKMSIVTKPTIKSAKVGYDAFVKYDADSTLCRSSLGDLKRGFGWSVVLVLLQIITLFRGIRMGFQLR